MNDDQAQHIVQAVYAQLTAGWRSGDAEAFAEPFVEDADFVNLVGMYIRGKPAIAALHRTIFDGMYANSTMTLHHERARFLAPTLIVAQCATEVAVPSGPVQGIVRGFITMVLRHTGPAWHIEAFQNARREGGPPDQGPRILLGAGGR